MTRSTYLFSLACLASVYCFGGLACSSSNEPATNSPAGAPAAIAGATAAGGASAGAPATGAAGAPLVTAGSGGTADGSSGAPASAAGSAGSAGSAGAAMSGGGAGGGAGAYTPLCAGLTTAAAAEPTKGGACTPTDTQLCYKTCGPQSIGFKTETCTAGTYQETSPASCLFPADADYSCYKLPATVPAACPTATISASTACAVAACTPCTDSTGHYLDSTMAMKVGHCVCPATAGGTSKWSCASDTSWPCPVGKGC